VGFNLFNDFDPVIAHTPAYQAAASAVVQGRGLLRYHNEGMMTQDSATSGAGWLILTGAPTGGYGGVAWNYTKMAAAFAAPFWRGSANTRLMVTFSAWPPAWNNATNGGKTLNASHVGDWTALVTQAVVWMATTAKLPLAYVGA
jgi:hypothetical protein